jgi:stage II sporulation protein D
LRRAFVEIDGVTAIEPLVTSTSGRIRQARVTGPRGELVLSGAELRRRLGLRSTLVRFQLLAPANPQAAMAMAVAPANDAVEPATAAPAPAPRPSPRFRFRLPAPPPLPPVAGLSGTVQPAAAPTLMAIGHGFGHGVGMSQWGAYGMALRGKSHAEILRHYYQGAELALGSF